MSGLPAMNCLTYLGTSLVGILETIPIKLYKRYWLLKCGSSKQGGITYIYFLALRFWETKEKSYQPPAEPAAKIIPTKAGCLMLPCRPAVVPVRCLSQ